MSYGTSAVRLDLGKEARIRTLEFFDIPGQRPQHEIVSPHTILRLSSCKILARFLWLIGSWKIATTTTGKLMWLYTFFLPSLCYLFSFVFRRRLPTSCHFKIPCWDVCCEDIWLKENPVKINFLSPDYREKSISQYPLLLWPLFWYFLHCYVLLFFDYTMQIGHALQEYSSGYKVENSLSVSNLTPQWVTCLSQISDHILKINSYDSVTSTLSKLQQRSPAYIKLLQRSLYKQMM